MRFRSLVVLGALVASLATTATPAHADIGTHCGGWRETSVDRVYANACYVRTLWYQIGGVGRAFVDRVGVDHLSIVVKLQKSSNATEWTTVKTTLCGFAGGEIAREAPGNECPGGRVSVDAGYLYRTRVAVVVFLSNGSIVTSRYVTSGMTT